MRKTVYITGGSRGIGRECVLRFAEKGYCVGFTYKNSTESARQLVREVESLGAECTAYCYDIADSASCRKSVEDFIARYGKIDVLVSNAGIAGYGMLADTSDEEIETLFRTNVMGMIKICREVGRYMVSEKSGCIITISSIWGMVGASCESVYAATKGAVIAFTKSLAKELGPSGIRANAVAPGAVDTDMMAEFTPEECRCIKEQSLLGELVEAGQVASTVCFLAEEGSAFTGQVLSPNCGFVVT